MYLHAARKEKTAPHSKPFFTLNELRFFVKRKAGAYASLITQRFLTTWLRANNYHCREVWLPGQHLRVWTQLTQVEVSTIIRQQNSKKT